MSGKKKRFRVDVDIDTFGAHLYVEARNADEARTYVEGMSTAELIEKVDVETEIKVEIEDVEECPPPPSRRKAKR